MLADSTTVAGKEESFAACDRLETAPSHGFESFMSRRLAPWPVVCR